jgi:hypothetical protein
MLGSTETEAVDRVVNAPKLAERKRLATRGEHAFRTESRRTRLVERFDVSEHLARSAGHSPQLVVQLYERNAESIDPITCDE